MYVLLVFGLMLKCNNKYKDTGKECGNVWNYKPRKGLFLPNGHKRVYTSCPMCYGSVKIEEYKQ
jgi:hypothetical protein